MVPIATIFVAARDQVGVTLPGARFSTVPIPTVRRGKLCGAVLFGRGEILNAEGEYHIWKPHVMATFAVSDCSLMEVRSLRVPAAGDGPIGRGISPTEALTATSLEMRAHYFQIADETIKLASEGADCSFRQDDVRAHFERCSGPALRKYFDRLYLQDVWEQR